MLMEPSPEAAAPFATIAALAPAGDSPGRGFRDKSTRASAGCDGDTTSIGFSAYFQPATNTYAPVERLGALYDEALSHPAVVGLAIGTRPDCVPDKVLDLLEQIAGKRYLSVEYGMQTIHDRSLDWMNRGHHHDAFLDAMRRSRGRGFEICVHVILGLPGESRRGHVGDRAVSWADWTSTRSRFTIFTRSRTRRWPSKWPAAKWN